MGPLEYLKENESKSLEQLKELLRIPSVSAQSEYKDDMVRCAQWVADYIKNLGMNSEICDTGGHPLVYGEYHVSDDVPTILIYGHYDVQPVDPLDLWKTSPFEPIEENGYIIARGATDDKGQMFAHLKGAEAYLKTVGKIPVNIKYMIEGEEESQSENLPVFIKNNKKKFAADVVLVSDGSMYGRDLPAINYGLRGIAFVEVSARGGVTIYPPPSVICRQTTGPYSTSSSLFSYLLFSILSAGGVDALYGQDLLDILSPFFALDHDNDRRLVVGGLDIGRKIRHGQARLVPDDLPLLPPELGIEEDQRVALRALFTPCGVHHDESHFFANLWRSEPDAGLAIQHFTHVPRELA